jgi:protein-tyrosine-phosphatase
MAEGWAKHLNSPLMESYSAGTVQNDAPKPLAIEVMEDKGIDMSHARSKLLEDIPVDIDILIVMGCNAECPSVNAKFREDWGLDDPSGGPKSDFEFTRDLIEDKVKDLIIRIKKGDFN